MMRIHGPIPRALESTRKPMRIRPRVPCRPDPEHLAKTSGTGGTRFRYA